MGERTSAEVDVSIGDVYSGQVIVGDHTTVQTTAGTKVTVLQVGQTPKPRLRPRPVVRRSKAAEILGRADELKLISAATAAEPVQLHGPDGVGKTAVLAQAAARATPATEGLVFESARHRSLDELQVGLYTAFWECDVSFTPAPAEFDEYLGDLEALLVLDDCELDRDELTTLLDRLPRCAFVLGAEERTLWSRGTARALADLDSDSAIGLLERELGHPLDADERAAAAAVVARIGGHPQSLVETAALIEDGRSSLLELGRDPDGLAQRFDPAALTASQQRVLAVLSALDHGALGTEHIGAVAGVADVSKDLRDLERRGWVKAGSPRYRSIRSVPPDLGSSREEVAQALLPHLARWAEKSSPRAVAEEAEGIEGALRLGAERERWKDVLALSLAAERGLFVSAAWTSCRQVLLSGLGAAQALGDVRASGYLAHQLGSRSLCLGEAAAAERQLTEALLIRERMVDERGAELTRHNLRQLWGDGGGGDGGGHGGDGGGLPRLPIALGILALVVALVVGAIAFTGGGDNNTAKSGVPAPAKSEGPGSNPASGSGGGSTPSVTDTTNPGTTTTPVPPGEPPEAQISSPADGATFDETDKEHAVADFACAPGEGEELASCEGDIEGVSVVPGGGLVLTPGPHTLTVTAIDTEGRRSSVTATYTVVAATEPPPAEPPEATEPAPTELPEVETTPPEVVEESEIPLH
ncbi:MAG: hypothetical protein JST59_30850 [Actinobacteria bacterium]|nr:hypothetical protein [Actinomycetota bacterium]